MWTWPGRAARRSVSEGVELLEGPAVGQGAVGPFDLPVGLRAVRPGAFVGDAQFGAGVVPEVGPVAAAVVGQDPFDSDAAGCEPGDGVAQDLDGGVLGLVLAGFDVGDTGSGHR